MRTNRPTKRGRLYLDHGAKKERWASEALPYITRLPSEVTEIPRLYIKRKQGEYPATTPKSGKWLLPLRPDKLDEVWPLIKQATEDGKLGQSSMAATARSNTHTRKSGEKIICVFTYDWTDAEDAPKVRQALRDMGIKKKLHYKAETGRTQWSRLQILRMTSWANEIIARHRTLCCRFKLDMNNPG